MILYIENPKDAIRKLLELINEFSKIIGYKVKTQKSLAFLYNNNEEEEKKKKKKGTILCTNATKRLKYLRLNLPGLSPWLSSTASTWNTGDASLIPGS